MPSRFSTAAARSAPTAKADGSLNPVASVDVVELAGSGVGVAGAVLKMLLVTGAGAGGGAGVAGAAWAGVEGA